MHISDKLKGSVGVTLTVLLIGSIAGNYIESQKTGVTTITYAELVGRTTTQNTESSNIPSEIIFESECESAEFDEPSDIIATSESENAVLETPPDVTTKSESENAVLETPPDVTTKSGSESIAPEVPPDITTASKNETPPDAAVKSESTVPVTQSAAATTAPAENPHCVWETDEANQLTVYVSSTGKYHKKCDCSGMKNYTEMTLQQAIEAGHAACKRCW